MTDERWLPVVGYEGRYEVSDQGRVRSLLRGGRYLKPLYDRKGYLYVCLTGARSVQKRYPVHGLVLGAFTGPRPPGMVCRHGTGGKEDNRLSNIRWGTPSENNYDLVRDGTHVQARKTHCPKGHPYVLRDRGGGRRCIQCRRDRYAAKVGRPVRVGNYDRSVKHPIIKTS